MKSLCLLFFLLFPFSLLAQSEELAIPSKNVTLGATLLLPGFDTDTVALIIAGSGPTDRNGNQSGGMENNSLKFIAEGLAQNNIASLRFDKRGLPGSPMDSLARAHTLFDDFATDVAQIISYLKMEKGFRHVVVIGHSLGSLEGTLGAQQAAVSKFISLAGMGHSIGETLRRQLGKQGAFVTNMAYPIIDSLEAGLRADSVPVLLEGLFGKNIQPYIMSVMAYDPAAELAKLDCPILIVNGTTDLQVTLEDGENLKGSNAQARMEVIENMNHVLKSVSDNLTANMATYNKPAMPLHPDLMPVLVNFIKE